ncbi:MAG: N-acetyltransferase family protein [Actinomycetota bacterium]|nr:N-acetyltransferase family protein [Actinomycetota bacterium]
MEIRLAEPDDAEAIRTIYNREVLSSAHTLDLRERSPEEHRAWMDARSGAHAVIVAVVDGEIAGFGSLSAYRDRPGYTSTVEDSVYVAPGHQGAGVGRKLLTTLVEVATRHGFHSVMARIVAGHEASLALHRGLGFELVGVEREVGRKFGRWIDVCLLQLLLSRTPSP